MEGSKRYQVSMRPIGHGIADAELIGETDDRMEAERMAKAWTDDNFEGIVTEWGELVWRCWE